MLFYDTVSSKGTGNFVLEAVEALLALVDVT